MIHVHGFGGERLICPVYQHVIRREANAVDQVVYDQITPHFHLTYVQIYIFEQSRITIGTEQCLASVPIQELNRQSIVYDQSIDIYYFILVRSVHRWLPLVVDIASVQVLDQCTGRDHLRYLQIPAHLQRLVQSQAVIDDRFKLLHLLLQPFQLVMNAVQVVKRPLIKHELTRVQHLRP
uniref:(northern house mosquito) hypothetical protein n=1 Tax=Culex pipiens TaxID=7175 RepID=A0A8D8BTL8_CULPI